MSLPPIATRDEWLSARKALLRKEKALTRRADQLATERRLLPMVEITEDYLFQGVNGPVRLLDLFDGRRQLIVYHFMFHPEWDQVCPRCTAGRDDELGPGVLRHLHMRNTSYVMVSRAPLTKLQEWRELRGWDIDWYSTDDGPFSYDFGATIDERRGADTVNYRARHDEKSQGPYDIPGRSCFLRDDARVFHTYSHYARAIESTLTPYSLLDLTALGRQEAWEKPSDRADQLWRDQPGLEQ